MKEKGQQSFLFSFFSNIIYYIIAFPILKLLAKIIYDLKIEGIENIRNIDMAAISVSNHVLILDCAMVGLAYGKKRVFYTTQEESFKIPFVRKLIKLLRAIPIPKKIVEKKEFVQKVDRLLQKGSCVHFYPEGSLVPYHTKIRPLKKGAFDFAIRDNVPIVPMVFCFREPVGIRKFLKRKKDVTLVVLEPIRCDMSIDNINQRIQDLKERTYQMMAKEEKEEQELFSAQLGT